MLLLLQAKDWVELFTSLGSNYEGFGRRCVTPYMHILVHHVPEMMSQLGGKVSEYNMAYPVKAAT